MPKNTADRPHPLLPIFLSRVAATSRKRWAQLLREDQVRRWQIGERVTVEAYLQHLSELAEAPDILIDLIYGEFLLREEAGERPQADEYLQRFPAQAEALRRQFAVHAVFAQAPVSGQIQQLPTTSPRDILPQVPGYELIDELGRGGCGVVYRARQKVLKRIVALKMIHRRPRWSRSWPVPSTVPINAASSIAISSPATFSSNIRKLLRIPMTRLWILKH